jgi:hypothetical protein
MSFKAIVCKRDDGDYDAIAGISNVQNVSMFLNAISGMNNYGH